MVRSKPSTGVTFPSRSATVTVEHTVRTMKFYNVAENELDSLSLLNNLQIGFAAAGTLCLSIGLPCLWDAIFQTTGVTVDMKKTVFFTGASVAFYILTYLSKRKSKSVWTKIGTDTEIGSGPSHG